MTSVCNEVSYLLVTKIALDPLVESNADQHLPGGYQHVKADLKIKKTSTFYAVRDCQNSSGKNGYQATCLFPRTRFILI